MTKPSAEALDAAGKLVNQLDADHITEIRAASWNIAIRLVALALDAAYRQGYELCREDAAQEAEAFGDADDIERFLIGEELAAAIRDLPTPERS
jgi:hypothetical protein